MANGFLTPEQHVQYGRFGTLVTPDDLTRCFHLNEEDRAQIQRCRGRANRLGFALQLTSVRYLGTFLDEVASVPPAVLQCLARQLAIEVHSDDIDAYAQSEQRWEHVTRIRTLYGYGEISEPRVGFRLARWLYGACWTGTERPHTLFNRAIEWLGSRKILLPGVSILERFVLRVRSRVEKRIWALLGQGIDARQRAQLHQLLDSPKGERASRLDQLRSGPTRVSGPAIRAAIDRLINIRRLGIAVPMKMRIPASRMASLARFANRAKAQTIARMPAIRRIATLVAFVHCLEATAQDEVLEILEVLLQDLFSGAIKADQKARLRTLKDLDQSATALAEACRLLLDTTLPDKTVRRRIFAKIPRTALESALSQVSKLTRPPDHVYYLELAQRHRSVRGYWPQVLAHIQFDAAPGGRALLDAINWMHQYEGRAGSTLDAPRAVIDAAWQRYVLPVDGHLDMRAYTFCVLSKLATALHRRDVFVQPSWRYADPRANLLTGPEWEASRPMVARTLGLPTDPGPVLDALAAELDQTYRAVKARLPDNPDVRFENIKGKKELILTPLDKLEEPDSLKRLRAAVTARLPRVEIAELVVEVSIRTGFTESFTHLTEQRTRATDLPLSLCACLLAEACNTGPEPFVRPDIAALRRDRLSWVKQNYLRDDTLTAANAILVAAQNRLELAHVWGGGEVASADGLRFVVPVQTVHAAYNPKYFGMRRGVTWYNLLSDQFSGLNGIPVPGTLRDSLILLAVVLDQQTELKPTQILTDTGAYSDVVFGLFRLLGFRFCPRLADIGGTRFWRFDAKADYGDLNAVSRNLLKRQRIVPHWDDMLRLAGSLLEGRVPAANIMRTLQVGEQPTGLALAIAEFGRIDKTLHALTTIDDKDKRRRTLAQLNRTEDRHSLARAVFYAKRGELRQPYREGQEDQLSALGLVVNMIVHWNTLYMQAAVDQLKAEGFDVRDEDKARLSPVLHDHINMMGQHSFAMPEAVAKGGLRPLRNPKDDLA